MKVECMALWSTEFHNEVKKHWSLKVTLYKINVLIPYIQESPVSKNCINNKNKRDDIINTLERVMWEITY